MKKNLLRCLTMTAASILYAMGVSLFLDPNSLAPGGVTGIAIMLNRFLPLETGTLFLLLNVPIMLLGIWKFGVRFILSTLYCIAATSLATNLLTPFGPLTVDPLPASLAGSALIALGMGLILRSGATTGGTDIIIKVLRLKFPHMKTGVLLLMTDALVVTASAFVFRDIDRALYAGLVVVVNSFLLDLVLYGRDGAKLIYIISDHSGEIADRLMKELDIGVTYVQGRGAYSKKEKQILLCVMRKALAPKAEEIVKEEDPLAFLIISGATEIYGEGYKNLFGEKL